MVKILVVEDERIVAWDLKETLEKLGHEVVDLAISGTAAIRAATYKDPDLVLMDIQLAGDMDGITAGNEIYQRLKIPVVYLSAHADELTLSRAIKTAPFGYIVKPFQAQTLQSTIQVACQRQQVEACGEMAQASLGYLLDNMGSGIIVTDRQGLVTFINPIAETLTGCYSAAAVGVEVDRVFCLGETDGTAMLPGSGLSANENPSLRAMRLQAPVNSPDECWLMSKDSVLVPISHTAAPILQPNGEAIGSILIFQDNSKQLSIQMDLQARNQDLELFQLKLISRLQAKTAEYQQAIACIQVLDLVLKQVFTAHSERYLLQIAIQQLGMTIDADYCWVTLHDPQTNTAKIVCEYINREHQIYPTSKIGSEIDVRLYPEFYSHLFENESWIDPHREIIPSLYLNLLTPAAQILICPITADLQAARYRWSQHSDWTIGEVGILTTGKPSWTTFHASPIAQILSYAVNLFRQTRTESIAPTAISSLEWLASLKDDFLAAIANAHRDLAVNAQMLQQQIQSIDRETADLASVLDLQSLHRKLATNLENLESEWQRQFQLVDLLIDLRARGRTAKIQVLSDLMFRKWAVDIVKICGNIATRSNLNFSDRITDRLPPMLVCPFPAIESIVIELFHHACKYTPLDCPVILDIDLRADRLEVSIISLEIEIPIWELETIFCGFTKNNLDLSLPADRPSLGLALVQKLLVELGGKIIPTSDIASTRIILSIPILQPDRSSPSS
jgi:CheY-like chemotaxis protein/signal transduction histidine kinase